MNTDDEDLAQQFASDNYAGICPDAWTAMQTANRGHASAYGDDLWTARAANAFRELFETSCELFFASMAPPPTRWLWRRFASPITA